MHFLFCYDKSTDQKHNCKNHSVTQLIWTSSQCWFPKTMIINVIYLKSLSLKIFAKSKIILLILYQGEKLFRYKKSTKALTYIILHFCIDYLFIIIIVLFVYIYSTPTIQTWLCHWLGEFTEKWCIVFKFLTIYQIYIN